MTSALHPPSYIVTDKNMAYALALCNLPVATQGGSGWMSKENNKARIPIGRACLRVRLSYNQLRRLLAIGTVQGGFDPGVGYFIDATDLERLEAELSSPAGSTVRSTSRGVGDTPSHPGPTQEPFRR